MFFYFLFSVKLTLLVSPWSRSMFFSDGSLVAVPCSFITLISVSMPSWSESESESAITKEDTKEDTKEVEEQEAQNNSSCKIK